MHHYAYGPLLLLLTSTTALESKMAARKVAAVIGYGPGIGHSCAALWSSKGYAVALVSRTASKLETAATQIPNSAAFPCDITDNAALTTTMKSIAEQLGPVDTLLYNAGNGVWKKFDEITVEQLDMAMKTNVYGLLTCAQCCTPAMVEKGGGNIIVTGATASLRGMPFATVKKSYEPPRHRRDVISTQVHERLRRGQGRPEVPRAVDGAPALEGQRARRLCYN